MNEFLGNKEFMQKYMKSPWNIIKMYSKQYIWSIPKISIYAKKAVFVFLQKDSFLLNLFKVLILLHTIYFKSGDRLILWYFPSEMTCSQRGVCLYEQR